MTEDRYLLFEAEAYSRSTTRNYKISFYLEKTNFDEIILHSILSYQIFISNFQVKEEHILRKFLFDNTIEEIQKECIKEINKHICKIEKKYDISF